MMPERDAVCVHAGDLDREDRAVRGTAVRHTRRLGAAVVLRLTILSKFLTGS